MTELDDKLHLFKKEAERINKELSQFLAYSETLLAEMIDKTPERDYSIDAMKELAEQFMKIRDRVYEVSQKMLARRHMVWETFHERKRGLLDEYLALYNDSKSLPADSSTGIALTKSAKEKVKELEMYEKLQNCWEDDFGPRH